MPKKFTQSEEMPLPPLGGACEGRPTIWWFPEIERDMKGPERRVIHINTDIAKKLCGICQVEKECLQYSLENEPFGIWGGLDENARHIIRVKEKIPLSRTVGGLRPSRARRTPLEQFPDWYTRGHGFDASAHR